MKKKTTLTLSKETLHRLDDEKLGLAAGGSEATCDCPRTYDCPRTVLSGC